MGYLTGPSVPAFVPRSGRVSVIRENGLVDWFLYVVVCYGKYQRAKIDALQEGTHSGAQLNRFQGSSIPCELGGIDDFLLNRLTYGNSGRRRNEGVLIASATSEQSQDSQHEQHDTRFCRG